MIYLPNHTWLKGNIKMCLDFLIASFLVKTNSADIRGECVKGLARKGLDTDPWHTGIESEEPGSLSW